MQMSCQNLKLVKAMLINTLMLLRKTNKEYIRDKFNALSC